MTLCPSLRSLTWLAASLCTVINALSTQDLPSWSGVAGLRAGAGAELGSRTDSPAGERPIRKPRGTIKIFSRGGTRSGYCSNFATFNCECPHPEESSFSTFLDCNTPGSPGSHTPAALPACWDSHMPTLQDPAIHEFHCFNIAYEHCTILSPSLKRSKLLLPKIPGFKLLAFQH